MEKLKPMDVYSELSVPFDIAAYCRGRRLSVEAVELRRALNIRRYAREVLVQAEKELETAEETVALRIAEVRQKMARSPI